MSSDDAKEQPKAKRDADDIEIRLGHQPKKTAPDLIKGYQGKSSLEADEDNPPTGGSSVHYTSNTQTSDQNQSEDKKP